MAVPITLPTLGDANQDASVDMPRLRELRGQPRRPREVQKFQWYKGLFTDSFQGKSTVENMGFDMFLTVNIPFKHIRGKLCLLLNLANC
jgi:hypothetical protein